MNVALIITLIALALCGASGQSATACFAKNSGACTQCTAVQGNQCTDNGVWMPCFTTMELCQPPCFAVDANGACAQCTNVQQTQCTDGGVWRPCFATMDACTGPVCYAKSGWGTDAACQKCPVAAVGNQCPNFGYTPCSSSLEACGGGAAPPTDAPIPTTSPSDPTVPTTTSPTVPTTTSPTVPTQMTTSATVSTESTTTTEATEPTEPAGNFSTCTSCPANTLGMNRPTFRGPNCYAEQTMYPQFGPNWKPSGKTAFERLIPSPSHLYSLTQWKNWGAQPITGLLAPGCESAALVYENFVCAIEYLQAYNKPFAQASKNVKAYTVNDFLNSGDTKTDFQELAAFMAHNFKETAMYTTFDERTDNPYSDGSSAYPAVSGQSYHGRGLIQISYNTNYGMFSEFMFNNKNPLLYDPAMVDPAGPMGVISAIWFWMSPHDFSGPYVGGRGGNVVPRDAVVHAFDGKFSQIYGTNKYDAGVGFGLTTDIINGGIECEGQSSSASHQWRVAYFLTIMSRMGQALPPYTDATACKNDKLCNSLWSGCGSASVPYTNFKSSPAGTCGNGIEP